MFPSLVIVNGILIDGTACSGEVTIPNDVTSIGEGAFQNCTGLTSITIPGSVTSIGEGAFRNCIGLTSISIPKSVTSIGNFAFYNCTDLTSINIPGSVTSIGDYAFDSCSSLTSITIPKSVTSIGNFAFYGCGKLTVYLENGSTLTSGQLGVDASKIRTYWNEGNLTWTLTADGTMTISGTGTMKDYYNENSPATQKKDNVKKVVIEEDVTSIGIYAFSGCISLTDITIPGSVTSIGDSAFQNTTWLKNKQNESPLVIVNGILIDGRTCSGEVTIPNNVTSIGNYAFYECTGLTSIEIPEGVKSIGANAFSDCTGLTSITIPKSVTSIGDEAFSGTPWLTNKQQDNPLVIVNGILIDGTTCSGEVTIPYGVTSIGNFAFYNCTGLTSISIPKSVTSIGTYTFSGCGNLTEITVPCDSTLTKDAFEDASEKVKYRHSLVKTDAKDATYTEAGNVEYWTCENCKKHFLTDETDVEAAKEVELSEIVKPVPVQVATATTQIKCVYGQDMDEINLQNYVKNADAVGGVSVKVATGSTMLDGMQLDGSKLSGKPAKAYTDGKDVTFTFTAKNGNTANLTLHFLVAKADPTVKVTVDGDSHTEGDLVEKLGLSISKDSTKGAAKIVSKLKKLIAGKNTLAWEFTPEDSENYNVVTGTVVVNAQTTTTTNETTSTTKETTATTKATTATSGTTSATKATTATSGTTSATKATTATSGTTSATKATTVTSGTTATTKATATTNETTATIEETTTTNETTATTEETTTNETTVTTEETTITNETTVTTEASTVTTNETTATTKGTTTTNGTTTTTEETTTTSETSATTGETTTNETTVATKASTVTTNETIATTEETTTTNGTAATSGTTSATKATTATSGTTSAIQTTTTTKESTTASETTMTTSVSNTESTAATSATTITTATTTSVTNIADEDLCSWALNDYLKKTGVIAVNAEITARSENAYEITLTDLNGNVLDVYTVDPKTGTGTDSSNAEVNLPQTGNNSMTNWLLCVGAALFIAFGFGAVKASGIFKRKEDE